MGLAANKKKKNFETKNEARVLELFGWVVPSGPPKVASTQPNVPTAIIIKGEYGNQFKKCYSKLRYNVTSHSIQSITYQYSKFAIPHQRKEINFI
jgi:hypothetical protein